MYNLVVGRRELRFAVRRDLRRDRRARKMALLGDCLNRGPHGLVRGTLSPQAGLVGWCSRVCAPQPLLLFTMLICPAMMAHGMRYGTA